MASHGVMRLTADWYYCAGIGRSDGILQPIRMIGISSWLTVLHAHPLEIAARDPGFRQEGRSRRTVPADRSIQCHNYSISRKAGLNSAGAKKTYASLGV